jgi:methionine synthase I (cobalamin-dependent)
VETNKAVITDGAWGTQLQALGLQPGECPDAWNLTQADKVRAVASAYVAAGSQVILSNTFGANRIALGRHGLAENAAAINRAGVGLSRQAADGKADVYASIGPSGKLLATGETNESELAAAFEEQSLALAQGGAQGLVLETFTDLAELLIALGAAKKTRLKVVACMVFDSGKNKDRTAMGVAIEQAVRALTDAGADGIGANCGRGAAGYVPICQRLHQLTDKPLWLKPNAGLPVMSDGKITYPTTPDEFAANIVELVESGAHWVGGCCGSRPEFVQAIARALKDVTKEAP